MFSNDSIAADRRGDNYSCACMMKFEETQHHTAGGKGKTKKGSARVLPTGHTCSGERDRVSAGIRNARAKGRKFGRPMRAVDRERILKMRGEGQSLRQIAENLGVGYGTVRERLKTSERKTPSKTVGERPQIKDT